MGMDPADRTIQIGPRLRAVSLVIEQLPLVGKVERGVKAVHGCAQCLKKSKRAKQNDEYETQPEPNGFRTFQKGKG